MEGDPVDDQARVATPRQALDAGASVILLGRSVTKANSPSAAAEAAAASLVA
jgi:orotidine-5'-phosphate decarboxylase